MDFKAAIYHLVNGRVLALYLALYINFCPMLLFGQSLYSSSDSALIFKKLDLADELDFKGELDTALALIHWISDFSRSKGMSRGLGYAQLKKADLLLKKSNYQEILKLLDAGYQIGTSLNDSLMMGLSHTQRSQFYKSKGDMETSILSLMKAITCYSKQEHQQYIGITYNDLAYAYSRQSNFDKAIYFGYEAIKSFEKIDDLKELGNAYGNMAVNYYKLNDKQNAINLFKKALSIQEKIGDSKRMVSTLGNLVVVYTSVNLDSALVYQEKALPIVEKLGIKLTQANSYSLSGSLYDKKGDHQNALKYFEKSLSHYREIDDPGKIANAYFNCAIQYDKLNDSLSAENAYNSALRFAIESRDKLFLQNYYQSKSKFYQSRKNFQLALDHYKESMIIKDSIFSEKSKAYISELNIKYETEKKELALAKSLEEQRAKDLELQAKNKEFEIASLKNRRNEQELLLTEKEKELQSSKIAELSFKTEKQDLINQTQMQNLDLLGKDIQIKQKQINQKNLLILLSFIALLSSVWIGYLMFNRFKLKKQLEQKEAQNKIRDRIAADLHDEVGSSLTSIHLLSLISEKQIGIDSLKLTDSVKDIQVQAKKIQQNISDIVWAIRSDNEKIDSLSARILEFAHKNFEAQGIALQFKADPKILDHSLGIEQRKELLLICKELINNVIKHAHATEVSIELWEEASNIILAFTDNGVGFKQNSSTGTGIKSMQSRADNIGGKFSITRENNLTKAYISIPALHRDMIDS